MTANILAQAKRIVVKIGSTLLVDQEAGTLKRDWLTTLATDDAALKKQGKDVILVSSGAIALGRRVLGLKNATLRLEESQAAAAVGQVRLAQAYVDVLQAHGLAAAQILLTLEDTEGRRRYLNARETLQTLLSLGAVPVINENDTVATSEIRFGDNDRLGARVATMMTADCLVLLSDVDGLYTANPQRDLNARHIPEVRAITPEIETMAEGSISGLGKGGMESKIAAAKIATGGGANVIIANGHVNHPLAAIDGNARYTIFHSRMSPAAARKRWIAGGLSPRGLVVLDEGAERALKSGKSLLAAGVTRIEGQFERGDTVVIMSADGRQLGRGLIAYNADEARRVAGKRTSEIEAILGYRGRDEMVHRDDLALETRDGEKS